MAVTAGWYNGVFRTPGDVFDLLSNADFSDSSVNYQAGPIFLESGGIILLMSGGQLASMTSGGGSTSGFGWMKIVAANTPLFDWLSSNGAPYLPPQDPLRRFVYSCQPQTMI